MHDPVYNPFKPTPEWSLSKKKGLGYLVIMGAVTLFFGGVGLTYRYVFQSGKQEQVAEKTQTLETISGTPLSSEYENGYLSTVIKDDKGNTILAKGHRTGKSIDASAVIKSEINDGDDEKITLKGLYKGDFFRFYEVKANGLDISLGR